MSKIKIYVSKADIQKTVPTKELWFVTSKKTDTGLELSIVRSASANTINKFTDLIDAKDFIRSIIKTNNKAYFKSARGV